MKKFFSLVLALVMALSLTTVAWGATVDVDNLQELKDAIAAGNDINVTSTINIYENIDIDLTGLTVTNNASGHMFSIESPATEVSITGGTVTIPAGNTTSQGFVDVNTAAKLTVNGGTYSGDLDLSGISSYIDRPGFFTNTASGVDLVLKNVTVPKTNYCVVWAEAYYNTLTVSGGSFTCDWIGFIVGAEASGVNVEFTDVTGTAAKGSFVEVVGGGTNNTIAEFNNCTISVSGADLNSAPPATISVSNGAEVIINGGTYTGSDNATTNGKNAVAIYSSGGSVTVNDGTLNGDVNAFTGTGDYEVEITGGTLTGDFKTSGTQANNVEISVSGGTFTTADVSAYLTAGVSIQPDGTVAATASFSGTSAITTNFSETGTYYVLNANNVWEKVEYVPADDNGDGTGTVAHFEGTSGTTYIICKKNDDNALKLTSGYLSGDKLLNYVKVSVVDYSATATAVDASLYATCETDINAKGYKVVDAYGVVTYYKDPATGITPTKWLLVDKEIKGVVAQVEGTDYVKGGHALIQNKSAAKDEAKTVYEYKCVVCGTLFDGTRTKAAGVTYTKYTQPNAITKGVYAAAGYDMTKVTTGDLWLIKTTSYGGSYVGGTTTTTPSTDKVTSAATFDAGIAMYVGMSVMAAAGSAVVLKKKED